MLKSERIGYGYNRPDRDFKAHDCDFVVIDTKATKRAGRAEVMQRLRDRDTLLIFSWKELAPGALKAAMVADLDRIGCKVEVLDIPPKPTVKPSGRGMSDEAKAFIIDKWRQPTLYSVEYVQRELKEKGHGTFSRNQLNHHLGRRTPPADDPLEVEE